MNNTIYFVYKIVMVLSSVLPIFSMRDGGAGDEYDYYTKRALSWPC